ncbi:zinc-binding domain-containing protein [Podospora conica]|nr:zinc-binding domain-containing protein [Schizothecium conicum]
MPSKKVQPPTSPRQASFQTAADLLMNRLATLSLDTPTLIPASSPPSAPPVPPQKTPKQKNKKKKPKPPPQQESATATYPTLHPSVVAALSDFPSVPPPLFNTTSSSPPTKTYETSIMGRFSCRNPSCASAGWGSKKIAIQIRVFRDGRTYDALVFKQRCRACEGLGVMYIDEGSYVERVVYRLKKWAGVEMETGEYNGPPRGPPHESELCEGCKAGCCPMLNA